MTDSKAKAISCSLRKTHPIGPIKGCEEDCDSFNPCVTRSKIELDLGLDEVKGPYRTVNINYDGRKRCCLLCGKSIAKPETPDCSFKGMFAIHLKAKHRDNYKAYKRGEISLDDLYYLKSL